MYIDEDNNTIPESKVVMFANGKGYLVRYDNNESFEMIEYKEF